METRNRWHRRAVYQLVAGLLLTAAGSVAASSPAMAGPEAVIVITADKTAPGSDGWVRFEAGHKQWVSSACRSELEADGVSVEVLTWAEISSLPDGPQLECASIPRPTIDVPIGSGVNFSSGEYACVQGWGIFEHPMSDSLLATQLLALKVTTTRIPLNEHCWLGPEQFGYLDPRWTGANYRARVTSLVTTLNSRGISVILDLHWNAPAGQRADDQRKMADADHAPAFWTSVATHFKSNQRIAFDLYNEPHGISWTCWRDGCQVDGWEAAGMQDLVDAVRSTGARQPIILSGLDFGGDLSQWLAHVPADPADNLVAGFHAYDKVTLNGTTFLKPCATAACWNRDLLPIKRAGYSVMITEVGQDVGGTTCSRAFVDRVYRWADANDISYLGWTYNPHACNGPALISNWSGKLTPAGKALAIRLRT